MGEARRRHARSSRMAGPGASNLSLKGDVSNHREPLAIRCSVVDNGAARR
ncbi:hypothetical protein OJF2_42520 [Aquisphaera giovannonii]|uniref:Uncharacterized protein n=1 Tax=Aquisphaera giovannonii TaxID=406548 RepID=A0A5B9W6D9_9BACT|nr:hypothetical protein OJF2_42520 [Aquisphaera giovannonii]